MKPLIPALALILGLAVGLSAAGQDESAGELTELQIIERILELQRQIDELVAALPPAARSELEERLAELGMSEPSPAVEPPPQAPGVAAAEPAVQPSPVAEPVRRRLARGPHCDFLTVLDSNRDGKVSALDRYWRHLYLWGDANGDRQLQDGEVASAYERDVREIAVDLSTFIRKKGTIGEVRVGEHLLLDVRGDGFGGGDDGVLVVDATKLRRGDGPDLQSASGEPLAGLQPLAEGRQIRSSNGEVTVLRCP